jgi:hypothetical protein
MWAIKGDGRMNCGRLREREESNVGDFRRRWI